MEEKYILVVNRDLVVGSIIQRVLLIDNVTFTLAQYFSEVEELLKKKHIDLVITDLVIDGIATNEYIDFLNKKLPNTPILVTTHMDHRSIKSEIELLGITAYIPLPLKVSALKATIKEYL